MSATPTSSSPAIGGIAVEPDNTTEMARACRSLWVGTGGDVSILTADGSALVFKNVPDGSILPVSCRRINASATTASDMVALY